MEKRAKPSSLLFPFAVRLVIFVLLVASAGWATDGKSEYYVIDLKPPSVSVIDSQSFKVVGKIPLDPGADFALLGPRNRYLYVLHHALSDRLVDMGYFELEANLSILDTKTRTRAKKIDLGWNTTMMSLTHDDRFLLCFSRGRPGKKKRKKEPASVTVIDTLTSEVKTTLSGSRLGKRYPHRDRVVAASLHTQIPLNGWPRVPGKRCGQRAVLLVHNPRKPGGCGKASRHHARTAATLGLRIGVATSLHKNSPLRSLVDNVELNAKDQPAALRFDRCLG